MICSKSKVKYVHTHAHISGESRTLWFHGLIGSYESSSQLKWSKKRDEQIYVPKSQIPS